MSSVVVDRKRAKQREMDERDSTTTSLFIVIAACYALRSLLSGDNSKAEGYETLGTSGAELW